MSELDRPGYLRIGSASAGPPTLEYGYWAPPAPPPPARHPLRVVIIVLVILVALIAFGVNRILLQGASTVPPWRISPISPAGSAPSASSPPASFSGASSTPLDPAALTASVDPAVVDINTVLDVPNGQGAGTGIVLTPTGEVLTNNHVISGATSITATDVGNGQTYPVTVMGYDRDHDLAVLQLQGASGLPTASIGDSSGVAIGDEIAAIGNAGGRGGAPSIATGTVTALGQTVTVSDDVTGGAEQLAGLIQVAADVEPGDSGGPLVNATGQVIGIDTAGSAGLRRYPGGNTGLAIPINDAIMIGKQIEAGDASRGVHIGPTGILGVLVQNPTDQQDQQALGRRGSLGRRYRSSGALVAGVMPGSPADQAGLTAADTIVSLDGASVDSPATLTTLLTGHHPGDMVRLGWIDAVGQQHAATVRLASGPPN